MPDPIRFNLATLGQLQAPANPGIGWVGPERPAESWADIAADPLSALFDVGRGAVTGDAPAGMNLQGLGALIAAAMPVAGGAKALRAATKAAKLADLAEAAEAAGIKAYHGSPHDFDQFSMSKIGTGEGAQAYGHGLYFAESPTIAKTYQGKVSAMQGQNATIDGRPINWDDPLEAAAFEAWRHDGDRKAAASFHERTFTKSDVPSILRSNAPLPKIDPPGKMYEVQIHASPDQFLDWDKPLSEQSPHVQKAIGNIPDAPLVQKYVANNQRSYANPSGENLHDILEMSGRSRREIGEQLQQAGIPGIRYLDAGSRSAGEGSRNYVIFDENLVSILKKYGVALPVIEGLREKAKKGGGVVPSSDVHSLVQ